MIGEMRWLVTVRNDADLREVARQLRELGCVDVAEEDAIPLADGEVVIPVEGPDNLPRLVQKDQRIAGVFNDSEVAFF
jgi:hypothetical protein